MAPTFANLALPNISKLDLTSDFSITVAPFLHQITELPKRLLQAHSVDQLQQVYTSTNPVITVFDFTLLVAVITFIVSTINRNYSQIDRLWSILPAFYNVHYWFFGYLTGIRARRLDIIAVFSLCWSARLTFNYWRKGGYQKGSEDYRWSIIKSKCPSEALWVIFNFVVISLFQSVLLGLVSTPTYIMLLTSSIWPEKGQGDGAFPQLLAILLLIEFISDNQQWSYHSAKKEYLKTAKVPDEFTAQELDLGFNSTGFWAYSRHPNFAAEQGIWLALYEYGCFQSNSTMNWTFAGAALYLAVFQGSTPITEAISAGKYPEYKQYQARVGRFLPSFTGEKWDDYLKAQEKKKPELKPKAVKAEKADKAKGRKSR